MGYEVKSLTTCDNCARLFDGSIRRHYCEHCDKYYYICPSCAARGAHCRFCGVPLKNSSERRAVRS